MLIPSACDDGSADPCSAGATVGLPAADRFLGTVVPKIEKSAADRADGLILITFDEAPQTGLRADPSAHCNTPACPNIPASSSSATDLPPPTTTIARAPTITSASTTTPTGGAGQVGLLVISRYVKPGTSDLVNYYNHYSLLATIENLFSLQRLGYAGDTALPVFDAAILNAH